MQKKKNIWNTPMSGVVITIIGIVLFLIFRGGLLGILGIILFIIGLIRWNQEIKAKKKDSVK